MQVRRTARLLQPRSKAVHLPTRLIMLRVSLSQFVILFQTWFAVLYGVRLFLKLLSPDFQDRCFQGHLERALLSLTLTICPGTQVRNLLAPDQTHLQVLVPQSLNCPLNLSLHVPLPVSGFTLPAAHLDD